MAALVPSWQLFLWLRCKQWQLAPRGMSWIASEAVTLQRQRGDTSTVLQLFPWLRCKQWQLAPRGMRGIALEAVTLQRLRSGTSTVLVAVSFAAFQAVAARAAWHTKG